MTNDKKTPIILHGYNLMERTKCNVDIVIKKKNISIIKGTVYNEKHKPAVGAAIEVKEINCFNKKSTILGYCFTDNKGKYVFSLTAAYGMCYEISIYSPLI